MSRSLRAAVEESRRAAPSRAAPLALVALTVVSSCVGGPRVVGARPAAACVWPVAEGVRFIVFQDIPQGCAFLYYVEPDFDAERAASTSSGGITVSGALRTNPGLMTTAASCSETLERWPGVVGTPVYSADGFIDLMIVDPIGVAVSLTASIDFEVADRPASVRIDGFELVASDRGPNPLCAN